MDSVVVNPLGGTELVKDFMKAGFVQVRKGRAVMLYGHAGVVETLLPILTKGVREFGLHGDKPAIRQYRD